MSAFAIAHLRTVEFGPDVGSYLEQIDATLKPYEGAFRIHGAVPEVVEEPWEGVLVVIEFPDLDRARAWYRSQDYQEILPLRTENSDGSAVIVDGVEPGYRAASLAAQASQPAA